MVEKLRYLFLPSEENNHRSKALSISSLSFYITIVVFFQIGINILSFINPNILGYATNISVDEIVRMTNSKRAENGLKTLNLDPNLSAAAAAKARDMFENDYWAHISPDGRTPWDFIVGSSYYYVYAGENLAKDFMDSNGVVEAWMASETHRDNILNGKYQDIGVAVVDGNLNGMETTLVVQMFGTKQARAVSEPVSKETLVRGEEKELELEVTPTPEEIMAVVGDEKQKKTEVAVSKEALSSNRPVFNVFGMTKNFSLVVVLFLLGVILVDMVIISTKRIRRLSGNSLFHFSFLLFVLLAVLLTSAGTIL